MALPSTTSSKSCQRSLRVANSGGDENQKVSKNRIAWLMRTSRGQVDRRLDPIQGDVTLDTPYRAARVLARSRTGPCRSISSTANIFGRNLRTGEPSRPIAGMSSNSFCRPLTREGSRISGDIGHRFAVKNIHRSKIRPTNQLVEIIAI
jgi:hypothetical protein